MALLYRAELTPSKLEVVAGWAPSQPWFDGDVSAGLEQLGAFRFDDPDGQVGIETLILRAPGGSVVQVPLTYRDAPLEGAEASLLGTLEHSVLGTRWVYDGAGDPVYLVAVAVAALGGLREAEMQIEIDGVMTTRQPTARVSGSGTADAPPATPEVAAFSIRQVGNSTVVDAGDVTIEIIRRVNDDERQDDATATLTGTWAAQPDPVILVRVTVAEEKTEAA